MIRIVCLAMILVWALSSSTAAQDALDNSVTLETGLNPILLSPDASPEVLYTAPEAGFYRFEVESDAIVELRIFGESSRNRIARYLDAGPVEIEFDGLMRKPSEQLAWINISRIAAIPEGEPNDTQGQAVPVEPRVTFPVEIYPAGDRDWFVVDLAYPGVLLAVSEPQIPGQFAPDMALTFWSGENELHADVQGDETGRVFGPIDVNAGLTTIEARSTESASGTSNLTLYYLPETQLDALPDGAPEAELISSDRDLPIFWVGIELDEDTSGAFRVATEAMGGQYFEAQSIDDISSVVQDVHDLAAPDESTPRNYFVWMLLGASLALVFLVLFVRRRRRA